MFLTIIKKILSIEINVLHSHMTYKIVVVNVKIKINHYLPSDLYF